jgi:hypothetical protein
MREQGISVQQGRGGVLVGSGGVDVGVDADRLGSW